MKSQRPPLLKARLTLLHILRLIEELACPLWVVPHAEMLSFLGHPDDQQVRQRSSTSLFQSFVVS
jgi:hypothetical protein